MTDSTAFYDELRTAIEDEQAVAMATLIDGEPLGAKLLVYGDGHRSDSLGDVELDESVAEAVSELLPDGKAEIREFTRSGETVQVYIESYLPPRRMVIIGAVHTAIPLERWSRDLGYTTIVIDAREFFATPERFPEAGELIVGWPDEALSGLKIDPQTDIVVLSHDAKFEDPALEVALQSQAGYIGAIGSKKTSTERLVRLREKGFTDEQLDRIHGPIGLNLGGRSPEEVAISILAEIIAVRHGKDPKSTGSGLQPAKADQPMVGGSPA